MIPISSKVPSSNDPDTTESEKVRQNSPSLYPQESHSPRVRKVIRLAIFLYKSAHETLSDEQRAWIANFQSKMNLTQIQLSLKFLHQLQTNPRVRARLKVDAWRIPTLDPRPKRREQRRIGVGYRDKGNLRPFHRPVLPGQLELDYQGRLLMGLIIPPEDILHGPPERSAEVKSEKASDPLSTIDPSDYPLVVPMLTLSLTVESLQLEVIEKALKTKMD